MNRPPSTLLVKLPARDPHGHKGTFGTVAVIGGCCADPARMIGAPALAARAALRCGAGLVRLLMPAPIVKDGIALAPSTTGVALPVSSTGELIPHEVAVELDHQLASIQCLAIGPGLGVSDGARAVSLRAVQQEDVPVVVHADAPNNLAHIPELHRDFRASAVLTPHPGEFKRLAHAMRITLDPTDPAQRPVAAEQLAQKLGCIVVLKGAGTVVSDGHRTWVCDRGNSCLATAGTGDVLTGVIAGLIAQHVRPGPVLAGQPPLFGLFEAAQTAVEAHALAAERWAARTGRDAGLLAQELADELPDVLSPMREKPR